MSKFNRANMFKPGEVPVGLKDDLLALVPVADNWRNDWFLYLCRELADLDRDMTKFESWVNAFIKENAPAWVNADHISANGLNVLCDWYKGRFCNFDYEDARKLRQEFLAQALANIAEQENAAKRAKELMTIFKVPRAKKMSDTKLYKTLKAKVGAEYMRTTVTPALRKVWKQRDTIEGGADFDTYKLDAAFVWAFSEDKDLWINLNRTYFK
jgi:hypothetical protein